MSTGSRFVQFTSSQLVSTTALREWMFDYLQAHGREYMSLAYSNDGTFGDTKIGLTSSGADLFTVDHGDRMCTDGNGHVLDPAECVDGVEDFMVDIGFPNVLLQRYYVGLRYAEKPGGCDVNPIYGTCFYTSMDEFIGESGTPDAVVDNGANITLTITSLAPLETSRKAYVWLAVPLTKESTYIELVDLVWDGVNNKITTSGKLGQTTISTTAADYVVLVPGPSFSTTEFDSNYHVIGQIRGVGPGNTPTNFSFDDQALFTVDLSAVSDQLDDYAQPITINNADAGTATSLAVARSRTNTGSFAYGDKVFIVGGSTLSAQQDKLDSYTMSTDTWSALTNLPAAREGARCAIVDNVAYVIGGRDTGPTVQNTVFRYDADTDTWLSAGAVMPAARVSGMIGVIDGIVYYAGGLDAALADTATLYAYDPVANSWSTLASMPDSYSRGSAAVYDGKLYVFAGYKNNSIPASGGNDVLRYDPDADSWTFVTSTPGLPGEGHAAASINGLIHVIGGSTSTSTILRDHFILNPDTLIWGEAPPIGGPGTYSHAMEHVSGELLITCGRFNAALGNWSARCDLSQIKKAEGAGLATSTGLATARTGSGVVVLPVFPASMRSSPCCEANGRVYFFGGETSAGAASAASWCFHPETKAWEPLPDMPNVRMWHSAVWHPQENAIYVVGGAAGVGVAQLGIDRYDIEGNSWSPVETTLDRCGYGNAVLIGDSIYAVSGGTAGSIGVVSTRMHIYNVKSKQLRELNLTGGFGGAVWGLVGASPGHEDPMLFFMGGDNAGLLDKIWTYNVVSDEWVQLSSPVLASARGYSHVARLDSHRVLVAGGLITNLTTASDAMTIVDTRTFAQSSFGYTLTTAKFHVATVVIDGVVYAFTGSTGTKAAPVANTSCDVVYHPTWMTATYPLVYNMTTGLSGVGVGFHAAHIFGSLSWKLDEECSFVVTGNRAT